MEPEVLPFIVSKTRLFNIFQLAQEDQAPKRFKMDTTESQAQEPLNIQDTNVGLNSALFGEKTAADVRASSSTPCVSNLHNLVWSGKKGRR